MESADGNGYGHFPHEQPHINNANDFDTQGSSTRLSAIQGSRSSPQTKSEPSDPIWLCTIKDGETVDLTSDDDETKIKQEDVVDLTFDWVKMTDDCIELSDSEDDIKVVTQHDDPGRDAPNDLFQEQSDASDTMEEVNRVTHEDHLTGLTRDSLSRDNAGSPGASSIFGNRSTPANSRQSILSDNTPQTNSIPKFGRSMLRTPTARPEMTPEKREEMMLRQEQLAAIFRNQGRAGGGNAFGGFAEASSSRSIAHAANFTGLELDSDAEAVEQYKNAKQEYTRKKNRGTNSFEDDVMWGKAKRAENLRRQRAGLFSGAGSVRCADPQIPARSNEHPLTSGNCSSGDEVREPSESLFVPQGQPYEKRTTGDATTANGLGKGPSASDEPQADEGEENDIYDVFGAEPQASTRRLNRSRQQEREESRQAGIEALLSYEARKAGKEKKTRKRKARPDDGSEKVKKPRTKKDKGQGKEKAAPKVRKGKNHAAPSSSSFNATSNLLFNDIFEEANNNADTTPMKGVWATRKDEALKAMLIDVPTEDLKKARSQKKGILESTKILGPRGRCSHVRDGQWRLKGMTALLYNYQVQGAAWMKTRENGDTEPFGGLLSDVMGLGKTLMTLACMMANPAPPGSSSRSTLIVCPPSLVVQWEQEIRKHIEHGALPGILRHHAANRLKGDGALKAMQEADVIITTYAEVRKSYPKFCPPEQIVVPEQKRAWWEQIFEERRGILHAVHWNRVVLDEAQAIKTKDSQTSIACRGLMAKHRWAVSATPIQNGIDELFPYFKLLRVQHTGDFDTFKENFCDRSNPDSFARLHAFLRRIMLRRTHADRIMGRPLVVLPRNSQETVELEFSRVERTIYDSVERRMRIQINLRAKEGNLDKIYSQVLTMLLRLRQMTGHPFILQGTIEELFEVEDIERLVNVEDECSDGSSRDMLHVMKTMIQTKAIATGAPPDSISGEMPTEETDGGPLTVANTSDALIVSFRKYLREMAKQKNWTEMKARSLCHKCRDVPDIPYVTDCYHLYCLECLTTLQQEAAAQGDTRAACCECARVFQESSCCAGITELEIEAATSESAPPPMTNNSRSNSRERRNQEKEALKWINLGGKVLPSTKTAAVIAQIEEWQRVEPNKKIIVFCQFHIMMRVLSKMFDERGWHHVEYHGRKSQMEREKAIKGFTDKEDHRIMIASLKAGGVGLNLTMASKVISVDLWWNSSVEQQAFCRVFRIGQESETFIKRFVVKNTVDERLQQMQKQKAEAIRQAIDDEKMLEALSIPDLMSLFGSVAYDEDDKPFILVDDEEEFAKEAPPTMLRRRFIVE
ncbi:MAG: hypothetical protein Q9212_003199 [Teloschistes hypoglaucus]